MRYTIKRGTTEIATIRPTGEWHTQIMGEEVVSMEFSLPQMVEFLTNDTVLVYGNTYYLGNEPVVEKISSRAYNYTLQFVGVKYELSKVQYFYPDSQNVLNVSEFSAIADANTLIDLVVQNANRVQSGWTKGIVATTQAKQVDFSNDNCLSALAKIAEAFELEYWVDGNKSIHFEERKQISGYTFEYGKAKGLKNITRTPLDNSNIVTRLYATGGEKNIPANYRNYSKNLKMNVPYLEKNTAKYGVIEHTKNFPDIFPKRLGTVTAVDANNPLIFTDANIDFDLNEKDANGTVILINNVSAKIKFNSGQLAGYTFEIRENGYNTATKTFTLLKNKDEKDIEVPSTLLRPSVGDEYVLFDVKMPQAYITAAETQLQAKAQKYLDENCEQRNQYTMEADPFYFKAQNVNIKIGNTVRFIDTTFSLDANLRVISVTKDLQNPYKVDFELSEKATISNIVRSYIESQKQATAINRTQKYNAEMARRSYHFAKEIQDNVFDGEGYFDAQKIKPLSIETKMLSVGSRLQQLNLKDVVLKVINNNTAVTNTAGQLIHLTIADTPRTWQIAANAQTNIGVGFHYIYAKAQRVGTNASIFISSNQIAVEEDETYYYFEVGYLGSVENGFRRIKTTYGFTQVSPGEITTGRISSANGQQYIDLKEDGIDVVGKVSIMAGSPAYSQIASVQDSKIANAKQESQTYADTQISNLQIGGRNLFISHTTGKFSTAGAVYTITQAQQVITQFSIKETGVYRLSFKIKKSGVTAGFRIAKNGNSIAYLASTEVSGEFKEYTSPSLNFAKDDMVLFAIYAHNWAGVNYEVSVKEIMFSKGENKTTWQPAPEDVQENINVALTKSQQALAELTQHDAEIAQANNTAQGAQALANSIEPKTRHINWQTGEYAAMVGTLLYRSATQVMGGVTGVVDPNKDNVAQWHGVGKGFNDRDTADYQLTHDGRLKATKATIKGDIYASKGFVGLFQIKNGIISSKIESDINLTSHQDPRQEFGNTFSPSQYIEISPNKILLKSDSLGNHHSIEITPYGLKIDGQNGYTGTKNGLIIKGGIIVGTT